PIIKEGNNAPFFLTGAIEFLDQPGEWFEDMNMLAGNLNYWPRDGEDLTRDKVVTPALETLVRIVGSLERPVSNVFFKNIRFEHGAWTRPSQTGHVPLQAG